VKETNTKLSVLSRTVPQQNTKQSHNFVPAAANRFSLMLVTAESLMLASFTRIFSGKFKTLNLMILDTGALI